jgi:Tfp pilus assembly protein PilF
VALLTLPRTAKTQQAEADVFVARAIVAYEEQRYEDALAALAEALRLAPDHVEALYYTGLVQVAQGRLDAAVEALERARRLAPEDEAVLLQLGTVYFGLRRYDDAQPLLERAFATNPRAPSLGYYVGYLRYRKADYQGALQAFEQGTTDDPKIEQLTRFYSGLVLASFGQPERAAREIEQAVRALPASPLTGPAERLREVVAGTRERERERRFRGEIRVGGFYDTNVPVNPVASPDPTVQDLIRREQESPGELGSVRLEYAFFRAPTFEAAATASLFTTYNNRLTDFNIIDALVGLSGTYRGTVASLPYQVLVPYTYDYLTLGGEEFVRRHNVAPYLTLVENPFNLTAVQLRYLHSDYAGDAEVPPDERRTGGNWLVGVAHFFRFQGDRHYIKLGYQYDVDDTEGRNYRYTGNRLLAGFQYTVPWAGLRLRYDFDLHLRDYKSANTLFPVTAPGTVKRYDREQNHLVGLSLPLPRDLTLVFEFQATRARSNIDIFTYDREFFSLSLAWSF